MLAGKKWVFFGKCNCSNAQMLGDVDYIAKLHDGIAKALPFINTQEIKFWIDPKH